MDIDRVTWHYDDDDDGGGDASESHVRKVKVKGISGINHEKIWVLKPNKNEKKKFPVCWLFADVIPIFNAVPAKYQKRKPGKYKKEKKKRKRGLTIYLEI